ncbi:MAG: hypothetical protein ACXV2A_06485, partial [Halobacteriota archaeon]
YIGYCPKSLPKSLINFVTGLLRCKFDFLNELIGEKRCYINREDGPTEDDEAHRSCQTWTLSNRTIHKTLAFQVDAFCDGKGSYSISR